VESVLGAILTSTDPYVQVLINNLRKDDLARDILGRVDSGPFVRISKSLQINDDPERLTTYRVQRVASTFPPA
jgi:hypothetical protein